MAILFTERVSESQRGGWLDREYPMGGLLLRGYSQAETW